MISSVIIKMVLPSLCLLLVIPTAWAHALSSHDSGYEHGLSDANKLIQGRVNDMYILQPGKGWTDHTGEFIQGYVEALNSTAVVLKDFKAGFDYLNNEWAQHNEDNPPHPFECPLAHTAPRSNFCIGYDAAMAYQNSDR